MVTGSAPFPVAGRPGPDLAPPQLELLYRSGLGRNTRLVSGALPSAGRARHRHRRRDDPAGRRHPGHRGPVRPAPGFPAAGRRPGGLVTGIIRPLRPASSFWTVDPVAAAPQLTYPTPDLRALPELRRVRSRRRTARPAELPERAAAGPVELPAQPGRGHRRSGGGPAAGRSAAVGYLPAATSVGTSLNASAGPAATIQVSLSNGLATTLPSLRGHRRRGAARAVAAVRQPGRDRGGGGAARRPAGRRAPRHRVHHDAGTRGIAAAGRHGRPGWRRRRGAARRGDRGRRRGRWPPRGPPRSWPGGWLP